jgi:hypothetical protein
VLVWLGPVAATMSGTLALLGSEAHVFFPEEWILEFADGEVRKLLLQE